jgi:hypothetical protein
MKTTIALLAFLLAAPGAVMAQSARLQLDSLDRLAGQASEVVNLVIDQSMLKFASAFIKGDGDEAAVREMLNGLQGIYIKSFEFDRDMTFSSELETIRKQLAAPGWVRFINIDSKRDRESAEIYSWREGDKSAGLAIVVAEPMELTVINIVGPFDLSKLGALQGLGVPSVSVDPSAKPR